MQQQNTRQADKTELKSSHQTCFKFDFSD